MGERGSKRRSIARRLLWRGLVALALGPVVAVLVAWGLALTTDQQSSGASSSGVVARTGKGVLEARWYSARNGMERVYWESTLNVGSTLVPTGPDKIDVQTLARVPRWSTLRGTPPAPEDVAGLLRIEVGWGWPWVAMSYRYDRMGTSWTSPIKNVRRAIPLGERTLSASTQVRALPLAPGPGLVANSLVFGLGVFVLLLLPWGLLGWSRALHRRRRGLCPTCGYDLAGVDRCPECGEAAPEALPESPAESMG